MNKSPAICNRLVHPSIDFIQVLAANIAANAQHAAPAQAPVELSLGVDQFANFARVNAIEGRVEHDVRFETAVIGLSKPREIRPVAAVIAQESLSPQIIAVPRPLHALQWPQAFPVKAGDRAPQRDRMPIVEAILKLRQPVQNAGVIHLR